ncbi:MAG TPA: cytochrome c maturation protein CcmE [Candidatus Acidoferrum sp.]|nr:cytochrome c maturation protein CcmE [Candidatus Acidoferrum sp.]
MNSKVKFGVGIGIILATVITIGWVSAKESQTYYHTISELPGLSKTQLHQHMRVSGNVAPGTIQYAPGNVNFVLIEDDRKLPVTYTGKDPLPDTFKDDAQALVEGKLAADGHFTADSVSAKCASKYEVAPTLNGK